MKLMTKVAVPLTALVVAAGVGAVYQLAGDADTGNPARGASSPAAGARVAQAVVGDPDDPATWRLPVEAYMPTRQQSLMVGGTRDELIDQCMDKAGYPAWKPAPDLPALGGKTLTDWRYGIHDAQLAAQRGYHPAKAEQEAYDSAMEEGAVDKSGAPDDKVQACAAEVDGNVPSAQPADIVQQVSGEAFEESHHDPKVAAAFAEWSACMKDKGYAYKAPMDANDDPRFSDPNAVSELEIRTAKADIACRDKTNVTRIWFDAESAIQRTKIADHLKEFDAAAQAVKDAVAKAKSA